MEISSGIKWTSVVWAGLLMFVIPILILFLIPTLYATYVGFSTRGDMAQINAAIQALGSSLVFQVFMYGVFAAVALWRSSVLMKKIAAQHLLHIGIAVVVAAVLVLAYYITASGGAVAAVWDDVLIITVMIAGGAFLGSMLKPSKPRQA